MNRTFWLIPVADAIDPDISGPYESPEARDQAAKEIRKKQNEEDPEACDTIFALDVDENGRPEVFSYSGAFFDED